MKRSLIISILILTALPLAGCITTSSQYRGAANGVEIKALPDGTRIINVSGKSSAKVGADGGIEAESSSNLEALAPFL